MTTSPQAWSAPRLADILNQDHLETWRCAGHNKKQNFNIRQRCSNSIGAVDRGQIKVLLVDLKGNQNVSQSKYDLDQLLELSGLLLCRAVHRKVPTQARDIYDTWVQDIQKKSLQRNDERLQASILVIAAREDGIQKLAAKPSQRRRVELNDRPRQNNIKTPPSMKSSPQSSSSLSSSSSSSSSSSTSSSSATITTVQNKLGIEDEDNFRCRGTTSKRQRCKLSNCGTKDTIEGILKSIASETWSLTPRMRELLEELARLTLCERYHEDQASVIMKSWLQVIPQDIKQEKVFDPVPNPGIAPSLFPNRLTTRRQTRSMTTAASAPEQPSEPIFEPFWPKNGCLSYRKFKEKASSPLSKTESKPGWIYAYMRPNCKHLKIGLSTNVRQRMDAWKKQCKYEPVVRFQVFTKNASRVEKLVHHFFMSERLRERLVNGGCNGGTGCSVKHEEWFNVPLEDAKRCVEMLKQWMELEPYDQTGALKYTWAAVIKRFSLEASYNSIVELRLQILGDTMAEIKEEEDVKIKVESHYTLASSGPINLSARFLSIPRSGYPQTGFKTEGVSAPLADSSLVGRPSPRVLPHAPLPRSQAVCA
ncbi:hypothetical protein BP6252_06824 [Coleophoma cylindrospora]|uniref:Bacteriophage T5 Orf172 DNA-binding domain-containing protein n=1 Tax=Coleophoma cylindrospora TaxID=1849047 RepID=A0A3D8RFV1_9HELO|nr:hypothetical protein BP6252_06824 [Coleophoma cylindrospora]